MKKHCVTKRSPGCGSQRLLRCRSHPAGRGPNSSSLFPPLAAVVAVASGLTDGSRAVSTKKEDPLSELQLREGVFFLMSQMTSSISTFTIYSICHSPQKSSAVQKVYRAGLAAEGRLCLSTTSQSHSVRQGRVAAPSVCFAAACIPLAAAPTAPPCFRHWRRSSPLPLVGEPLAKPFTLRGLPKPPLQGEVARRQP